MNKTYLHKRERSHGQTDMAERSARELLFIQSRQIKGKDRSKTVVRRVANGISKAKERQSPEKE